MSQFRCDDCGQDKTHPEGSCTTGYATDREGKKICFDCCAIRDKASMIENGTSDQLPLYLSKDDKGTWYLGNWPSTLRFRCGNPRKGRHNMARTRYDVWFNGPDGKDWHGVQYGENTQIVHCKRIGG